MSIRKPKSLKAKKTSKTKKPKSPPINRSPAAFERAFENRIGSSPKEYIQRKIKGGNAVKDIRYLYELEADGIAKMNHCVSQPFERYYDPPTMNEKEAITVTEPKQESASQSSGQTAKKSFQRKRINKLVRDRIPELLEAKGQSCTTEKLSPDDYLTMLEAKLDDELSSYHKMQTLDELADLLEVMGALVKARGHTWDELTKIRKERAAKYGDFSGRTLLWEVIE